MTENKCRCGRIIENSNYICDICFASYNPKQYCRILTYAKFGKARKQCKICKMIVKTQWHHYDYTKPYDCVPLCKECHKIADKNRDKSEDSKLSEFWKNKLIKEYNKRHKL